MLKIGTTFSGIGAAERALKNLKIPHIVKWACDIDKYAKETYFANHTCEKWYDDITKINLEELEYVDMFVAGFPCQSFSYAGKQRGPTEDRGLLVNYVLDITDKIKPKYVVFENVKGLLGKKFNEFYQYIVSRFSKDYNYQLIQANSKINTAFTKQKNFQLQSKYGTVNQANKVTLFGDKKIRYENYTNCQNCIDTHGIIYPDNKTIRKFTPRECFRLQGFPDEFIIHKKDNHAYKQAGNTITVNVLEAIFKELLNNVA